MPISKFLAYLHLDYLFPKNHYLARPRPDAATVFRISLPIAQSARGLEFAD
jgi:hypothetical protein